MASGCSGTSTASGVSIVSTFSAGSIVAAGALGDVAAPALPLGPRAGRTLGRDDIDPLCVQPAVRTDGTAHHHARVGGRDGGGGAELRRVHVDVIDAEARRTALLHETLDRELRRRRGEVEGGLDAIGAEHSRRRVETTDDERDALDDGGRYAAGGRHHAEARNGELIASLHRERSAHAHPLARRPALDARRDDAAVRATKSAHRDEAARREVAETERCAARVCKPRRVVDHHALPENLDLAAMHVARRDRTDRHVSHCDLLRPQLVTTALGIDHDHLADGEPFRFRRLAVGLDAGAGVVADFETVHADAAEARDHADDAGAADAASVARTDARAADAAAVLSLLGVARALPARLGAGAADAARVASARIRGARGERCETEHQQHAAEGEDSVEGSARSRFRHGCPLSSSGSAPSSLGAS
jgi:hypothetical protein